MFQIQNNWSYGETLDENAKTHPMLRPYKTFSEKVGLQSSCFLNLCVLLLHHSLIWSLWHLSWQDKEIYRWPIKESIKAMLAWEWNLDKARDEEESEKKKAASRKISQTAQVYSREMKVKIHNVAMEVVIYFVAYHEKSFCFRRPMIQAMATVHSPLTSHTWLYLETCRYSRKYLNLLCYKLHIWSIFIVESVHSLWQSNWQKIIITPGDARKSWNCSLKVKYFLSRGVNLDIEEMRELAFAQFM